MTHYDDDVNDEVRAIMRRNVWVPRATDTQDLRLLRVTLHALNQQERFDFGSDDPNIYDSYTLAAAIQLHLEALDRRDTLTALQDELSGRTTSP